MPRKETRSIQLLSPTQHGFPLKKEASLCGRMFIDGAMLSSCQNAMDRVEEKTSEGNEGNIELGLSPNTVGCLSSILVKHDHNCYLAACHKEIICLLIV